MKNLIYLDFGVNIGITLDAASEFNFKHLYGFEPLSEYFKTNEYYKNFDSNDKITIIEDIPFNVNKVDNFYLSINKSRDGSSIFSGKKTVKNV